MATPADYPALVAFWNTYAGWDVIDQSVWENRFVHTASGPSGIGMAYAQEQLIGQLVFIPYRGQVKDRAVLMFRPFAAVLAPNSEIDQMGKVFVKLYWESVRQLAEGRAADLIYILPDPRWAAFLSRYGRMQTEQFPLYSRPLEPDTLIYRPQKVKTEKIKPDDDRLDNLWQRLAGDFPVSPIKDKRYFQWKAGALQYDLYLVNAQDDQPIGLFALQHKGDSGVCMIAELLTPRDAATQHLVLQSALYVAAKQRHLGHPWKKLGIMAMPATVPLLEALEFEADDYNYLLMLHPLNEEIKEEVADISNWRFTAAD